MRVRVSLLRSMVRETLEAPVQHARQETSWTCGPASIKAILKALHRDVPEDELVDISDADSRDGTSPADLVSALEKLGLPARRHETLTTDDLRGHLKDGCPVILDVDMWGGEHWVVVHACDDRFFKLMDPSSDEEVIISPGALDGIRWAPSKQVVRGGIVVVPDTNMQETRLNEDRKGVLRWYKNRLPGWPEYVIRDMLYARVSSKNDANAAQWRFQQLAWRYGFSDPKEVKWRLETINVSLDAFEPKTRETLEDRMGHRGSVRQGQASQGIPKDAERHATQAKLATDKGSPSSEPIIAVRFSDGSLELLEGWHRTIQALLKWPQGYSQRAYVLDAREEPSDPAASAAEPEGGWEWL